MLDINFNQIIEMIEKRKNNAYRKVNEEMILLYLEVGKFLYELKEYYFLLITFSTASTIA